jgi:hypothetical protein
MRFQLRDILGEETDTRGDITGVRELLVSTVKVYPDRSRLEFGGTEVAFHCDKFNTRIIKGMEDVIGVEQAARLLAASAEATHYAWLKKFFIDGDGKAAFSAMSAADKLAACFEVYKVFAYGAFDGSGLGENGGKVVSKSSYIAEGWLENMERWKWVLRENAVCHDACGTIAAAAAIAYGKPQGTYVVTEIKCRSKGDDICEFAVEVRK